jgi:hypothetical protein
VFEIETLYRFWPLHKAMPPASYGLLKKSLLIGCSKKFRSKDPEVQRSETSTPFTAATRDKGDSPASVFQQPVGSLAQGSSLSKDESSSAVEIKSY